MDAFACNLIDGLGGTTEVARKAKASTSTVQSWRKRLTSSRLDHLLRIAADEGMHVDPATGEVREGVGSDCIAAPCGSRNASETGNGDGFTAQVEAAA